MRGTRTILGFAAAACIVAAAPVSAKPQGHPSNVKATAGPSQSTQTAPTAPTKPHTKAATTTVGATPQKTTSTTSPTSTRSTTLNPIARKIASKPNLNAKLTAMLPVRANGTPMSLNDASKGFRNQGQFIAALHASQRYDCGAASCFTLIKKDMVNRHMSLGQSIQDVKKLSPTAARTEARDAEHEAGRELDEHHEVEREPGEHHFDRDDHQGQNGQHTAAHGNRIAKQIASNPQLSAKVQALLPAGLTVKKAAKGFSSEREFLAALHASKDLNIPFAQMKAEMTGRDRDSLTQAIRELKPAIDARAAATTARQEAAADLKPTA